MDEDEIIKPRTKSKSKEPYVRDYDNKLANFYLSLTPEEWIRFNSEWKQLNPKK